MAEALDWNGQRVWLKRYGDSPRTLRMYLLDISARCLGVAPLRAVPVYAGDQARQLEQRRLRQLAGLGVRVPRIIASANGALVVSDLGPTLSELLKHRTPSAALRDQRVALAIAALADAHGRGAYLGQPFARNIALDGDSIGFFDIEQDPLAVMPMAQAQARDWLIFTAGVARFFEADHDKLAKLLSEGIRGADPEVRQEVSVCAKHLGFLSAMTRPLPRRARSLGGAVTALRQAVLCTRHFGDTQQHG